MKLELEEDVYTITIKNFDLLKSLNSHSDTEGLEEIVFSYTLF